VRRIEITSWRSVTRFDGDERPCKWERGTLEIGTISSDEAEKLLRILHSLAELQDKGAKQSGQFTLDAVLRELEGSEVVGREQASGAATHSDTTRDAKACSALGVTTPAPAPATTDLFVDVRDHGATGNGVTDDAPAIQDAIDAAAGMIDDEVLASQSIREVLCHWVDRGVNKRHDLIVLAEKHKNAIPVLKRTRDLKGRVVVALKSLELPG
jgi:hypothetical protein